VEFFLSSGDFPSLMDSQLRAAAQEQKALIKIVFDCGVRPILV
jgi:hypothetical protein